jgi:adenosylmethionine-8-amino-7-oxononanoate aminotransferase
MSSSGSILHQWGTVDAPLPRIERAHDEFLVTEDGDEIIDATSGLVVVNLGHSLEGVEDVMAEQAGDVAFVAPTNFRTDASDRLTDKLAAMAPGSLNTSFFVSSGSQAIESALKLARVYHRRNGDADKIEFISRWQSYHGATLGALSLSGRSLQRTQYKPLMKEWTHIEPAYPYRWEYSGTPEEQARKAAQELEATIRQHGEDTVGAFVAEPVSGATLPAACPHPAYFEEVRRICDEYDVLLIADEVMAGFGRTGEAFSIEHHGVVPDIMVVGKGLSSGYAPISAMLVRDEIADEFEGDLENAFDHGFTYAGNPVSTAVAAHVVDHYSESLYKDVRDHGELLREALAPLEDHPNVGEIRNKGLLFGIEFVADPGTKEPFDPDLDVDMRMQQEALERGAFVYPGSGCVDGDAGDHITVAPPLTMSDETLTELATILRDTVDSVTDQVD